MPILSAVNYMSVAAGYLRLAQHTVENSQSQRRLECYVVLGPYPKRYYAPSRPFILAKILRAGTNASNNHVVVPPWVESASLLGGGCRKGLPNFSPNWESKPYAEF
ncbi:uncharacterized protein LDX57_007820 [Aspergillus melleus]|uniref:uncharacterized protein n=1 Tax=Aspergillus melleus TaxID=138277 RepID=UPI001E8E1B81|nr:uncharacterized protein LDX57_007820 [Aspergillus melleus]KAH8430150.1 hypothetical protein LDX57_007820 [Aspergillus melleus]